MTLIIIFLFGLSIGSMLNAYIWRLSIDSSIWKGRSVCTTCRKPIAWYDLIPVLSYIFLKGKCRHCEDGISLQYPIVELASGLLFTLAYVVWVVKAGVTGGEVTITLQYGGLLLRNWYFIALLIILFFTDLKWMTIPDRVTIPGIITAFMFNGLLFLQNDSCSSASLSCLLSTSWSNYLLAGIIGGGFFWIQYAVSKGKWVGGGDIRFGLLLGVMFGFPKIIAVLMLAYMLGGVIATPLLLTRKKTMKSELPFGTFLAVAGVIILFMGDTIFQWLAIYPPM